MTAHMPGHPSENQVQIDVPRLWGGGLATALVAALVAVVGVLICTEVLDIEMAKPPMLLAIGDSFVTQYAITSFLLALVATGLAHLLTLTTPRPKAFFSWIIWLATIAGAVLPFAQTGDLAGKVATGIVNLMLGACISSLLSAVLSRTVYDTDQSWQQYG